MSNGMGCTCAARSSADCGCEGVDWTDQRIYDLQEENARLKDEIIHLNEFGNELSRNNMDLEEIEKVILAYADLGTTKPTLRAFFRKAFQERNLNE